jgi:hypothetical protein
VRTDPALHTTTDSRDDAAVARQAISLRIERTDLAAWKRAAKDAGITLTDYIVRRVNGTTITIEPPPPPSVKPKRGR